MIYLLDSNVWVAILRGTAPRVASRYAATNRADIRTCSVVVAELRYGCAKSSKPLPSLNPLLLPQVLLLGLQTSKCLARRLLEAAPHLRRVAVREVRTLDH
jgi:predicted nucleic acid-binding protein